MARERLRKPSLPEVLSDALSDFADLFRKELRLAQAELSSNVSTKLRGSIWLAIAGLFALLALALILGGLVAWITTFDVSLHFAFLIVAAGVGLVAVLAYAAEEKPMRNSSLRGQSAKSNKTSRQPRSS